MTFFNYQNQQLLAEQVPLLDIAKRFGTPCYVYSRAALEQAFLAYQQALGDQRHLICYAVKANSNIAVLNVLARLGAGFDIVSIGELERVLRAGGDPGKVVFSGVAKTAAEIERALLVGIHCFNVESEAELERINAVAARLALTAPVSIRVNPDVDANTHPYISTGLKENKFGIDINTALDVYTKAQAMGHVKIKGIDCHIGSQLTETAPFVDALKRVLGLMDKLAEKGIEIEHLDLGGGLGVCYKDEEPPTPQEYIAALKTELGHRDIALIFEPGRSISANAGVLLSQVEFLKPGPEKNFAIIDAAMNDMIRPSLYQAWLDLVPLELREGEGEEYDFVGPVCETGDFLAKQRRLNIVSGDVLALKGSGAYGFTMSSNYNSRPKLAEIMVDGDRVYQIRARESLDDLMRGESLLP